MELAGRPFVRGLASGHLEILSGPLLGPVRSDAGSAGKVLFARTLGKRGSAGGEGHSAAGVILGELPGAGAHEIGVPAVAAIPGDMLSDGDRVRVDGDRGTVELPELPLSHVVTAFVERSDGRILVLRRSDAVSTFRGKWAAVSGYVESSPPLEQAYTEVLEETGIRRDQLTLITAGTVIWARGEGHGFAVHPFHFRAVDPRVRIEREHTESRWVPPSEIATLDAVPKLKEAWEHVVVDSRDRTSEHAAPRKR